MADHVEDAALVLSVIAHAGADGDEAEARAAFARGCKVLSMPASQLLDAGCATPQQLDAAIDLASNFLEGGVVCTLESRTAPPAARMASASGPSPRTDHWPEVRPEFRSTGRHTSSSNQLA